MLLRRLYISASVRKLEEGIYLDGDQIILKTSEEEIPLVHNPEQLKPSRTAQFRKRHGCICNGDITQAFRWRASVRASVNLLQWSIVLNM